MPSPATVGGFDFTFSGVVLTFSHALVLGLGAGLLYLVAVSLLSRH